MILEPVPAKAFNEDVTIKRKQGVAVCNVPHTVIFKSWYGYNFGYVGSGPAELAINILNAFVPPRRRVPGYKPFQAGPTVRRGECSMFAAQHHIEFMYEFLVPMDNETGGTIPAAWITAWIAQRFSRMHEASLQIKRRA